MRFAPPPLLLCSGRPTNNVFLGKSFATISNRHRGASSRMDAPKMLHSTYGRTDAICSAQIIGPMKMFCFWSLFSFVSFVSAGLLRPAGRIGWITGAERMAKGWSSRCDGWYTFCGNRAFGLLRDPIPTGSRCVFEWITCVGWCCMCCGLFPSRMSVSVWVDRPCRPLPTTSYRNWEEI